MKEEIRSIISVSKEINTVLQEYEHIHKINENVFNVCSKILNTQNKLVYIFIKFRIFHMKIVIYNLYIF